MPRGKTGFAPGSAGPLEFGAHVIGPHAEPFEHAAGAAARLRQGSEQDVLGVELWIAALEGLAQRLLEHRASEGREGGNAVHRMRRRRGSDRLTKTRQR